VRFVSSGTEAVMTSLRLARAATDRRIIVKFAGCYHGHVDSMLVSAGSGSATLGLPDSPGVTPGQVGDTVVLPYNDVDALGEAFDRFGSQIAAVITEAVPANMGVVPPLEGFNRLIVDLCRRHGALVILDEVMTGFRIGPAGWWGRVGDDEGWTPDLFTFGKVIGGGFPLAAVGGRDEIMNLLAPMGPVYQAGTLSGNPVASTAGLATLRLCDDSLYTALDRRAQEIREAVGRGLERFDVPHRMQWAGNLFSCFFTSSEVVDFDQARSQDTRAFAVFFQTMMSEGVSLPPSAYEAWFVSGSMTDADVEVIGVAAEKAAGRVRAWLDSGAGAIEDV